MKPTFFKKQADFRKWLEKNHEKETELQVGYYKKDSGIPSITWPESVDEALCFGWIDGIRRSIDDKSYMIRFTPRKTKSIWSAVNTKRYKELKELGLVKPQGEEAFGRREDKNANIYSFEQEKIELGEEFEKIFKKNKKAWEFFHAQAASYRKAAIWWVISAKQESTRLKRLNTMIEDSQEHRRIKHLVRPVAKKKTS